ncbi:CocE/NonD family hydrolase [Nodosilinea sp. LEGE 07088]|uniref:CocE/NonD family hydrolase n=1 Tax=Nodosilinea sp. LEGE 07088 TaxID=2777968 RepID=UPI00187EAE99|nr:CocE/NonD family hydrolase [Nodosilinea sp. LEGE 07088]MBE9137737.1 CocE/NonD family hydrolase [Nodosilinea sp. LEGE 07088]
MMLTVPGDAGTAAVKLEADLYYPLGDGPFPVLLMRQPYGRAIASTVVYAHPTWYASHGYIVVIQDVRGRGTSGGEFDLFRHEADDGYATVQWAAGLPQSSGRVGMYGFSYQGMTQIYAASKQPPALQAIAPAMVGYDLYSDWAYENGALPLQIGLGWALQLAAETARRQQNPVAYQALFQAAHALPLDEAMPARPQVLQTYAPDSFFHHWLDHPQPDSYWLELQPDLGQVDLPMLHIGGWYDPYLRGDLRLYQQMVAQSHAPQSLWIGPWGHLPWCRRVGALDFGPEADSPIDCLQLRWFDRFLKGQVADESREPAIRLFVMGLNQWQECDRWPTGPGSPVYLTSTGLAGLRSDDGRLTSDPPASLDPPPPMDVIVHDPWRPVPSLGGHCGLPAGPFDRAAIDSRTDVLTYTTPPLPDGWTLVGVPTTTLYCRADTPSFDLSVVLSEVRGDGRVMHLTQGHCRVDHHDPNQPHFQAIALALHPTACTLAPGHQLRLSVAAACFPAYALNSGTGAGPGDCAQLDYRVTTLTLAHDAQHPACITLPINGLSTAAPARRPTREGDRKRNE